MGSKKQKQTISTELEKNPLKCGAFVTEEKQDEKWLGQYLSARGLAASVEKTVTEREGKIRAAGLEIMAIVEDWRSKAAGGLETALLLWEACCLPSLLAGAATKFFTKLVSTFGAQGWPRRPPGLPAMGHRHAGHGPVGMEGEGGAHAPPEGFG